MLPLTVIFLLFQNVPDNGKKSVTFQHGFTSNVVTILDKMAEVLNRKGIKCSSVEVHKTIIRLTRAIIHYYCPSLRNICVLLD